jgi:predicted RNase H-like HicB family nuclease
MKIIELIREDWVTLICEELKVSASGSTLEIAYKALEQAIEFNNG